MLAIWFHCSGVLQSYARSYDPSERSDAESISWLICFESTHELSKFSIKLAEEWKKTFQVSYIAEWGA